MTGNVVSLRRGHRLSEPSSGWVHVDRFPDGSLMVQHESASGGSFGIFASFDPDQLEDAVRCALGVLADCRPARLGRVALPLGLECSGGRAA